MNFGIEALISVLFIIFSSASLLFLQDNFNRIASLVIALLLLIAAIATSVTNYASVQKLILVTAIYLITTVFVLLKQDENVQDMRDIKKKIYHFLTIIVIAFSFFAVVFVTQNITNLSLISEEKKLQAKDDKFLNSFKNSSFGIVLGEVGGSISNSKSKQDSMTKEDKGQFKMPYTSQEKLRSTLSDNFLLKNFAEFILLLSAFLSIHLIYRSNKSPL